VLPKFARPLNPLFLYLVISINFNILCILIYLNRFHNIFIMNNNSNYKFIEGNLQSFDLLKYIFQNNEITHIIHFAAQSHVQNSFSDSL
jgi:dTDP-D-glucose 4,6-dehydratase